MPTEEVELLKEELSRKLEELAQLHGEKVDRENADADLEQVCGTTLCLRTSVYVCVCCVYICCLLL